MKRRAFVRSASVLAASALSARPLFAAGERVGRRRRTDVDDAGGVEPFERERWTSTVSEQPFDACSVLALDADGRVDAESTGALPREHAVGVGFVEQALRAEVAEHTALDYVLEFAGRRRRRRLRAIGGRHASGVVRGAVGRGRGAVAKAVAARALRGS